MLKSGNYYWNGNIFGKVSTIINSITKHANQISRACENVYKNKIILNETNETKFCPKLFSKIPSISIDYAVMEKEANIGLYPLNVQWSDMGSWDSVAEEEINTKILRKFYK